jgi:hypothetical protein
MNPRIFPMLMLLLGGGAVGLAEEGPAPLQWRISPHPSPGHTGIMQMNGTAALQVEGRTFAYSVGGNTGPVGLDIDTIWVAPVEGAEIGPWRPTAATLDGAGIVYHTRSTVGHHGRLYMVGGRFNEHDGFDQRFDGIRIFQPDATGDIPADGVTLYHNRDEAITPPLDSLESAAVVTPSRVHPGDAILFIIGGNGEDAVRSVRIDGATGGIVGAEPGWLTVDAVTKEESLPTPVGFAPAVLHGGRLYLVGGNPPSPLVHWTTIGDDDRLAPWRTTTAPLPEPRLDGAAASFRGHLYVIGGTMRDNSTTLASVLRAAFSPDGDITGLAPRHPAPPVPGHPPRGSLHHPRRDSHRGGKAGRSFVFNGGVDWGVGGWLLAWNVVHTIGGRIFLQGGHISALPEFPDHQFPLPHCVEKP